MAQSGGLFLLDPENAPFAAGASPRLPAGSQGGILIFESIFVLAGLLIAAGLARRWAYIALLNTSYAEAQGQSLTVRYALRDPAIATIQPGRIGGPLALSGFCLVWSGFVVSFSWLLVREVRKRHRLSQGGQRIKIAIGGLADA